MTHHKPQLLLASLLLSFAAAAAVQSTPPAGGDPGMGGDRHTSDTDRGTGTINPGRAGSPGTPNGTARDVNGAAGAPGVPGTPANEEPANLYGNPGAATGKHGSEAAGQTTVPDQAGVNPDAPRGRPHARKSAKHGHGGSKTPDSSLPAPAAPASGAEMGPGPR